MQYELSMIISDIAMQDSIYNALERAKHNMAMELIGHIIDKDTENISIDLTFKEGWHELDWSFGSGTEKSKEYRIQAIADITK